MTATGAHAPVSVVGSGVMGAGIALTYALAGTPVRLWGRRAAGVDDALDRVERDLDAVVELGLLATDHRDAVRAGVTGTTDLPEALDGAALACEAVSEQLELKRELLAEVERHIADDALLTSTTSALSPTALSEVLARPGRFVVTHFAQPAHLVELVEVVPGDATDEQTVERTIAVLGGVGKLGVRVADVPGFLWSRLQQAVLRELVGLVDRGALDPVDADLLVKVGYASRLPAMGPFEHADLAGLDLVGDQADDVWPDLATTVGAAGTSIGRLREQGATGMNAGRGFYDWNERDPQAFKAERDREIVRRLQLRRGADVRPDGHVFDPTRERVDEDGAGE